MNKSLLILPTLVAVVLFHLKSDRPEPSRKEQFRRDIKAMISPYRFYDWSCNNEPYEAMSKDLGTVLIWTPIDDYKLYGQSVKDTVWMYTSRCSYEGKRTFLHEIAHVLYHFDGVNRSKDLEEIEANAFMEMAMTELAEFNNEFKENPYE